MGFYIFRNAFSYPGYVAAVSVLVLFLNLVGSGQIFELWSLHRDSRELETRKQDLNFKVSDLHTRLKQTEDPQFLEKTAVEHFNLAEKNDLIFIFADEGAE